MCSNYEFLGLRLKVKDADSKIGQKIVKPLLKMYGYEPPSHKQDSQLTKYMNELLQKLFDQQGEGFKKQDC